MKQLRPVPDKTDDEYYALILHMDESFGNMIIKNVLKPGGEASQVHDIVNVLGTTREIYLKP
jgi:hypothetical protein